MNYTIEIRTIETLQVACSQYNGPIADVPKYMPLVFKSIRGQANGAPFVAYHSLVDEKGEAEMSLCVPTQQTPTGQGVEVNVLPGGKAACLTHVGPYETLHLAYQAMNQYLAENNLVLCPPCREVFVKGPGMVIKGNPEHYITELIFPLEDA